MTQLIPYLRFNEKCKEAMQFYKECLGAELSLQTIGESPMANQMPKESHDSIMHSTLSKNGVTMILASDMIDERGLTQGNNVSLCLDCETEEELNSYFSNLSKGAKSVSPLQEEFWGGTFGQLTDKYGTEWMFNFTKPKANNQL